MALWVNTHTLLLEDYRVHNEVRFSPVQGWELRTSSLLVVGWMIIQCASDSCLWRHYRWTVLNFHGSFHSVYRELLGLHVLSLGKHLQTYKWQVLLWQKYKNLHTWLTGEHLSTLTELSEPGLFRSNCIILLYCAASNTGQQNCCVLTKHEPEPWTCWTSCQMGSGLS